MNFVKQLLADNAGAGAIVRVLNQVQSQLVELFTTTASVPVSLVHVALKAGQVNLVKTTLSTRLVGWNLTRLRAQATVWDTQDTNTNAAYLALWTSADVSVDLVVF